MTSEYLTNADDLQIKMAQGAKPGEGGQLPGHKVYPWIAKTRHSTPGVGLISPPPHHDIYSIEDLAQLIHDLKNSNPSARVHVKLVAEVGVGTVAAGVAKAKSDVVLISGHDGGTGASPLTSLKHAGAPWELGLAETQQTLRAQRPARPHRRADRRPAEDRPRRRSIAALLGAEEFGFATAPLVVSGCIMMRVCHLDTCPVGIATQNPELRARYSGKPEFVENFMLFVAEEVRELLAELGLPHPRGGHRPCRDARRRPRRSTTGRPHGLDLSPILHVVEPRDGRPPAPRPHPGPRPRRGARPDAHRRGGRCARDRVSRSTSRSPIRNVNRTVGTMLGHELTKRHGGAGLPDDTIVIDFDGLGRQQLRGVRAPRRDHAARRATPTTTSARASRVAASSIRPPETSHPSFVAEENIIAGNVMLYGATGGELLLRGIVGERFCVRNSGATAVVEGVGDHGCEYMTGGRVVVLGPTGPELRCRHVRWHRLRVRRRRSVPDPGQLRDGRARGPRRRRPRVPARRRSTATATRPARPSADELLDDWDDGSAGSARSCRATTSGCSRPRSGPRTRAWTWSRRSWRPASSTVADHAPSVPRSARDRRRGETSYTHG